jgi:hypothetical protein
MYTKNSIGLITIALTVLTSGCTSITGSFTGTPATGGNNWCNQGEFWESSNPATGESVRYSIAGIVNHDGRQTCKAEWTSNTEEGIARIEIYFTEDGDYQHMIGYRAENQIQYEYLIVDEGVSFKIYDENGTLINEGSYGQSS